MPEENFSQSFNITVGQNLSNNTIGGMASGDMDVTQNPQISTSESSQPTSESSQPLTQANVVELITKLEELFRSSDLPEAETSQAIKYLEAAKEEAQEEEPDKDFAAKNLQKACTALKVLKETGETVEAGTNLWKTFQLIITKLLPWLGKASSYFI
ncbi:hypothetical protein [Moorena sp. SIO4G3]|uniref:hypothetical protein n=1 Tax=Moorena sp. SIO4G3 TaxID=2607821 RepID=UPI00142AC96B|nr:hypothetical protein [Moorena sp. SIO4G3]NEO76229.1 hypothetical protein [Moorena sp. SIO4G3]